MFDNIDINQVAMMLTALIFAVTIHEVAHGSAAYMLGDDTAMEAGRLTLNPLKHLDFIGSVLIPLGLIISGAPVIFGYAKPVPVNFARINNSKKGIVLVASAGVAVNLCFAFICGLFFKIMYKFEPAWSQTFFNLVLSDFFYFLLYSVIINSVLAVFNLIPIPPLDGSRIISVFLPPFWRGLYARIERFGILIIFLLLITNLLDKTLLFFINPITNTLLGR
ncbi:MAG TPA: site-2 protease family protein [Desulfobacteraceae bacterium]|nr:site-2 protease family protein [Desulfobacteraceae bacterium]